MFVVPPLGGNELPETATIPANAGTANGAVNKITASERKVTLGTKPNSLVLWTLIPELHQLQFGQTAQGSDQPIDIVVVVVDLQARANGWPKPQVPVQRFGAVES